MCAVEYLLYIQVLVDSQACAVDSFISGICLRMHMEISIEIRAAAVIKVTLNEVMSVACGRIHQGHEQFSNDPQGRNGS